MLRGGSSEPKHVLCFSSEQGELVPGQREDSSWYWLELKNSCPGNLDFILLAMESHGKCSSRCIWLFFSRSVNENSAVEGNHSGNNLQNGLEDRKIKVEIA